MREIERTSKFKRDFKNVMKRPAGEAPGVELSEIIMSLANDADLPQRCHDHELIGDWKDQRGCHVRPDLILIYPTPDDETLLLVRIGSHAKLGL
jgi:mRNA interferase YafQ